MRKRHRLGYGILYSLMLAPVGAVFGAFVGARFLIPQDAGMAAGAMVLLYGLLGLAGGIALGAVFGRFLPDRWLRHAAVVTVLAGLGTLAILAKGFFTIAEKQHQARLETLKHLPDFQFELSWSSSREGRPFTRLEYRSAENFLEVSSDQSAPATYEVPIEARGTFLSMLREFDLSGILRESAPCHQSGPRIGELNLTIHEALPPDTSGQVLITRECLEEIDELARLVDEAERLWRQVR